MRPKITGANIPASKKNNKKVWRVQKLKETTTETLWNAEENVQKWANEKQNSKSSSKVKMKRQKKKIRLESVRVWVERQVALAPRRRWRRRGVQWGGPK